MATAVTADESKATAASLQVGDWRVDAARNEVSRRGEAVRLEPKAIEVLMHLARRAGEVVSREELLSAVWPGLVVGDNALAQAVIKLRKALGDDAHQPTYIETISKRGYRLIAPVSDVASSQANPRAAPGGRRLAYSIGAATVLVVSAVAAVVYSGFGSRLPWPFGTQRNVAAISPPIIAVLPLSNLSGDPSRDYFSDGVTEDIINALGRFSGVRVISRTSVEPFRTRAATPKQIRAELGARYVLKGSVREAGGRLRVAMELSDTQTGLALWSDRFDGEGKDLFEIQDRIVKNIVGTLAVRLTRIEQERTSLKPPGNLEAYDLVLQARALVASTERVANRKARGLLARAVDMAPDYAEAWVVFAGAENQRAIYGWMEDPEEGLVRAEQYVLRALALDEPGSQARAHGVLSLIHSVRGRFELALAQADLAIELNPSDAFAYDSRGSTLMYLGRFEEAIRAMETSFRFNPAGRNSSSGFNLALVHYALGQYPQAIAAADAALTRYPDEPSLHAIRAATLGQMGRLEMAREASDRVRRLDPFFASAQFGSRFVNPQHHARVQEGLRKAGL